MKHAEKTRSRTVSRLAEKQKNGITTQIFYTRLQKFFFFFLGATRKDKWLKSKANNEIMVDYVISYFYLQSWTSQNDETSIYHEKIDILQSPCEGICFFTYNENGTNISSYDMLIYTTKRRDKQGFKITYASRFLILFNIAATVTIAFAKAWRKIWENELFYPWKSSVRQLSPLIFEIAI